MKRMNVSISLVVLVCVSVVFTVFVFPLRAETPVGEWIPYIPSNKQITIYHFEENNVSYLNVSILFSDSGYMVSDWGTLNIMGNNVSANVEVWKWQGITRPVITVESHIYALGSLSEGQYAFTLEAWDRPIQEVVFSAPELPSVLVPLSLITVAFVAIRTLQKKSKK